MTRTALRRILTALAAAVLSVAFASTAPAQEAPPKKVWTNDDLHALEGAPLSFESDAVIAARHPSAPGAAKAAGKAMLPKERDPGWYRVQLAALRTQLHDIEARQRQIRAELDSHRGGSQGLNLAQDAEGVTPQSALDALEARRKAVLKRIDALEDQAHRNGIPPGELRREPTAADYAAAGDQQFVLRSAAPPEPPHTEQQWRTRFAELRLRLAHAEKELDVLQQELGVAVVQYYPDPNKTLKESVTFREENRLRARIADKKAEIGSLHEQISDLEDALRRAGGPPGWAR